MYPEIKKLWTDALRSDEYEQGFGYLRKGDQYCCYGVLCDLAVKYGIIPEPELRAFDNFVYRYDGAEEIISSKVKDWAGLPSLDPIIDEKTPAVGWVLTHINDKGTPFTRIADIIDRNF